MVVTSCVCVASYVCVTSYIGGSDGKFPKWEVTFSSSEVARIGTMYKNSGDSDRDREEQDTNLYPSYKYLTVHPLILLKLFTLNLKNYPDLYSVDGTGGHGADIAQINQEQEGLLKLKSKVYPRDQSGART